jgi:hypothetical protein
MKDHTRVLNRDDAHRIESLRLAEYSAAPEFELLRPDLLMWDTHDDDGVVLGVWAGDELLSTLRGVVVADRAAAEDFLTCTVDLPPDRFPALVLGRGATLSPVRRLGLNALLRRLFLQAMVGPDGDTIRSSLGLPYEGASRLRLMRDLGYETQRPERIWDPEAQELRPALLAVLPRDRFGSALTMLDPLTAELVAKYPWAGSPLTLPSPIRVAAHEAQGP